MVVAPPGSSGANLLLARAVNPQQESRIGNQTGGRVFLFLHTDDFWGDYNYMQAQVCISSSSLATKILARVVVFQDLYGNKWDLVQPAALPVGGGLESTQDIYHYKKVDGRVITAGQPTEEQLHLASAEGFQAVINLAVHYPGHSLPDEAGLARSLGMAYYHIPVAWDAPQPGDFTRFSQIMDQTAGQRVLIHCIANYRATAFYALYAIQRLGWSDAQASAFIASIWRPAEYPVWEEFIESIKSGD